MGKVNKELEVDRFIRAMKHVRIILKTLFTKTERYLISNNRRFLVPNNFDRHETTDFSSKYKQNKYGQKDLGNYFDFLLTDSGIGLKNPGSDTSEPITARKLITIKP